MTWFLRHGFLVGKQYGFLEARDKFFLKVPITMFAVFAFNIKFSIILKMIQ